VAIRELRLWNGDIRVHVRVEGDGPPVLYFHPAGGLLWNPFLDWLRDSFTIYAPYHPGVYPDAPEMAEKVETLDQLILLYEEMVRELGVRPFAVLGQSFGGMVAAELAAHFPDITDRLVLFAPIGVSLPDRPLLPVWMIEPPQRLTALLFADPNSPIALAFATPPADPDEAVRVQTELGWAIACTGKFVWPIADTGLAQRLHRIRAETLLVWGAEDRLVPAATAQEFAKRIPRARVAVIERCGHIPEMEAVEETIRIVRDFFSAVPSATAD